MLRLLEIVLGIVLIYVGIDRLSTGEQVKALLYGAVAVAGLVLAVHGILLFTVPDFFAG
jgi:Co/Zn/Cd efflux system component